MHASLLTIGDELLLGQVVDTNAAWIGAALNDHGIALVGKATVGDSLAAIERGLARAAAEAPVVLLTGGLGPTADDLTLEALARHTGRDYVFREDTYERIRHIFEEVIRRPLLPSHRRQAFAPDGAETLRNDQGTAPGIWLEHDGTVYVALPGVPREMRHLVTERVVPRLLDRFPASPRRQLTLHTAGWGETQIEEAIRDVVAGLPPHVSVAYLPGLGSVRVRLNAAGEDATALDAELDGLAARVESLLPPGLVFGRGDTDLVRHLHELLRERGATVATAESCTGGRLAHVLTEVAGASAVFPGGVVAYANEVKESRLGVSAATLRAHGAVSEPCVIEMARGARVAFGATYALATSGIAGPGGGTPDKPVGTIWLAAAGPDGQVATRLLHRGRDRETNIAYAANAAVDLLRRMLVEGGEDEGLRMQA